MGLTKELRLGNLDAKLDWGHARDYVRAMHLMLQRDTPDDYVVAIGETHTVREFCELAFGEVGLDYRAYVRTDERFLRPAEVDLLVGDATKARRELEWRSQYTFPQLAVRWFKQTWIYRIRLLRLQAFAFNGSASGH
jgi:GDPmannose 4,6-dehydratase